MMKKYFFIPIVIATVVFTGCTASNFNEMTKDARYKPQKYTVNENYQVLYKRALDKSRECHEGGMFTAAWIVDGQIYSELKKAEISIYLMGGLGKSFYNGAEIEAIDNNHSNMIIYSFLGRETDILKREFTGECKKCYCKE